MAAWEALRNYVNAPATNETSNDFVEACWDQAVALIDRHVRDNTIPPNILDRARIEVGADLYYRKASKNGIVTANGADVTPIRINKDPMAPAYPLLDPYLPAGFA